MIDINYEKIKELTPVVKKLSVVPEAFINPDYYPSTKDNVENIIRYFIFMVAIDHRTSFRGKHYEEYVNGKFYHGADLLYKLGKMKYDEDPDFFSPKSMANITLKHVAEWLSYGNARLWDIEVRTMLLRDLGVKLLKLYNGETIKLLEESNCLIRSIKGGLVDRLKVFRAYEDPVEKKAFLLTKFLERRKIFSPKDVKNLEMPVDNHLTRIAFRIGLVTLGKELLNNILSKNPVSYEEDIIVRLTVRKAYKVLTKQANISPLHLDDILWTLGRKYCIKPLPCCITYESFNDTCPFKENCDAYKNPSKAKLIEHNYLETWYY